MKIREQNGRLYLHGSFPRKDGKPGNAQYMITLRLTDTARNRREADKWMSKAKRLLKAGEWNWNTFLINKSEHNPERAEKTWAEAIKLLYRRKVTLGRCSESSWAVNYMGTLKLMPQDQVVTSASLQEQLETYSRDSYTYKKLYGLTKHLADLCAVTFPDIGVPLYNRATTIYGIPSDEEICRWVLASPQPYRWYFGMMATYGLRPHECDSMQQVESNGLQLVQVGDEAKTGYRTVIPLENEWVELFDLLNPSQRPDSARDPNRKDATSVWLNHKRLKMGIDYRPYMLRHAYAARLWREGGSELTIDTAAKLMGHSVTEHLKTYRRWIDPNQVAMAAAAAIARNRAKDSTKDS